MVDVIKRLIPDRLYIQLMYFYHKRRFAHFRNPITFMADKYLVREYIRQRIGEEYLVPLVGGPWLSTEDINLKALPEQFVLKCSNGHGVEICTKKSEFDFEKAKIRLYRSMSKNLYWYSREWPYKNSKSVIIAEELLSDDVADYKFYCFNGEPIYLCIITGRFTSKDGPYADMFDMNGNHLEVRDLDFPNSPYGPPPLPRSFSEMKEIARTLSEDIPFVRIDLYEKESRPLFGEITFFDSGGFSKFVSVNISTP